MVVGQASEHVGAVNAEMAASRLVSLVRARPWGVAVAALVGVDTHVELEAGDDPLDEDSLFEVGSVTKTMTGTLVADAILRGEVSSETRLAEVLGIKGGAGESTVGDRSHGMAAVG